MCWIVSTIALEVTWEHAVIVPFVQSLALNCIWAACPRVPCINAVITGDTGINEEAKGTTDYTTTNPIEIIHWEVIARFC